MSKKILVIDDQPDVLQVVSTVLNTKGHETITAHDGKEGLEKVRAEKPDLVICDLIMPLVSGLQVCREMRKDPELEHIPIIVMSAAGKDTGKSEEFFREGLNADEFIMKPFDPLNLLGRVEAILRMQDYEETKSTKASEAEAQQQRPVSSAKVTGTSVEDLATLDPAGLVEAFIDAPNRGAFDVEYHCLDEKLHGGLDLDTYAERRREAQDPKHQQRLLRVISLTGDENAAKVTIEREDQRGRFPKKRQEQYELERGPKNWQITMVRPVS